MTSESPNRPWQRVAAYVLELPSHVRLLQRPHFARHGKPKQLMSHNGSQFTSRDFLKFAKDWISTGASDGLPSLTWKT